MFGRKPNVEAHVEYILKKASGKLWILRHNKKAGMSKEDMLFIFNTTIRPSLEFAAPTFHSMLTAEQRDRLERVQKRACKLIFGWDTNYDTLVANERIETLDSRRERLTINFAKKTVKNERFADWFEENEPERTLRRTKKYKESYARTDRLRNSPLYYMRRKLNAE